MAVTYHIPEPSFTLADVAIIHEVPEEEVRRVVTDVLGLAPKGPFSFDDLLRVNRILGPVPEPGEIP